MRLLYWTYIEKEMSDLIEIFEQMFPDLKFYRDYEDTWEWIQTEDRNTKNYLNISRRHNWETGIYDDKLKISIELITPTKSENIDRFGMELKNRLQTKIYFGEVIAVKQNTYEYRIIKEF